jgi:hypothetical protein
MTTPRRDPEALLSAYLAVGMEVLPDRVIDAVLDEAHRTRQRTVVGPWRARPISRATFAGAAVVALLALGAALFVVGQGPSPTPSEEPSPSLPAIVAPSSTPSRPSVLPTPSPVADTAGLWIATGTMGTPRGVTCSSDGCSSEHLAVRLLDGRVLVVGGTGDESDPASAELYDPASGTWSDTGSMLKPQAGFPPTLLLDGRVLVGDVDDPDPATDDDEIAGAEVYDPANGTWSSAGNVCFGDTATLLRDGRVLGICQSGPQVYDPDGGTWSATGTMIAPRHYHTATMLRDGKVLVAGGSDGGDIPVDAVELYDPGTGSWTAIQNTHFDPPSCVGCSGGGAWATLLQDGTLLLMRSAAVEIYDPASGTWTALAKPTEFGRPRALLPDGTVLVTDLRVPDADPQPPCTAAAVYDPRTGTWTTAASMLRCGNGSSFTPLFDGTVLMAGGSDCNDNVCVSTSAAELYVPHGVSPPPLPAFPSPPPPVFPSPTPVPTPLPPAAGPVPPNARTWKVTVDNESSEPATLFVADEEVQRGGMSRLVGSATPNVVPAGATVKVTFLFPEEGDPNDGWIFVNPRPGEWGQLVGAADIGIPGKIVITADGVVGWASP